MQNKILEICHHIRKVGKLVKQARTEYGVDWYALDNLKFGICDGGYTTILRAEPEILNCYVTGNKEPVYENGNAENVIAIYNRLMLPK